MSKYDQLVANLAIAHQQMKENKDAMEALLSEVKTSDLYTKTESKFKTAKEWADELDAQIRSMIVADGENDIKPDHDALTCNNGKVLDYDPAKALKWAIKKKYYNVLKLQVAPFKKLATSLIEGGREIPGASVRETPKPTIKTDLSPWLVEVVPDDEPNDLPF